MHLNEGVFLVGALRGDGTRFTDMPLLDVARIGGVNVDRVSLFDELRTAGKCEVKLDGRGGGLTRPNGKRTFEGQTSFSQPSEI
jgi:hypothetical protein